MRGPYNTVHELMAYPPDGMHLEREKLPQSIPPAMHNAAKTAEIKQKTLIEMEMNLKDISGNRNPGVSWEYPINGRWAEILNGWENTVWRQWLLYSYLRNLPINIFCLLRKIWMMYTREFPFILLDEWREKMWEWNFVQREQTVY